MLLTVLLCILYGMKLYSKFQLIITALIVAVVVGTAATFFTITLTKNHAKTDTLLSSEESSSNPKDTASEVSNSEEASDIAEGEVILLQEQSVPGNADSFVLQTAVKSEPVYSAEMQQMYTRDELQNITVYEKCNEAVVNITTEVMAYNWFLEPVPQSGGSGSGSIIDKRGYVVTNVHVISDAYKIYISLYDGSQYEGTVVGVDKESDIAVLKFDPPKNRELQTIPFGDSDSLKVGQKLIAIGNPFGFERTMTTGIVSGLGRPIQTSENTIIRDMIQTDTAINPGNSGGPLLDTSGKMVGINTMIYSTSGSSAGIGFAVPVNTARRVVSDLIQYGEVRRGDIDAVLVQLSAPIVAYARLGIKNGLLVSQVEKGSLAEKAGLQGGTTAVRYGNSSIFYLGGDVITSIDDISVQTLADYYSILESKQPGDTVKVTVYRNKKYTDLSVTLSEKS